MSAALGRILAVIPARGGSKGLPGKNLKPFAGLPLIAHSILFAKSCPEVARCIVTTDSTEIAEAARRFGAAVPFMRPAELAQDATPLWPVLRHALAEAERQERQPYDLLMLLDPTSPAREAADVVGALHELAEHPEADGVIAVSRPEFNPLWHCVVEREGWMEQWIREGGQVERRQDAPPIYRINGALYVWRAAFVRSYEGAWQAGGRYRLYEIPELRAMSIDTAEQFERAEALVKSGLIHLPWLRDALLCAA